MGIQLNYEGNERRRLLYIIVFFSIAAFTVVLLLYGWIHAFIFSLSPLIIIGLIQLVKEPIYALLSVFIVNYFVMGITRYIPGLQGGIVVDVFLLTTLLILLIYNLTRPVAWHLLLNPLTLVTGIWLVYCLVLVFNS